MKLPHSYTEFAALEDLLYGLTLNELRYLLDSADIYDEEFPNETFCLLKNNKIRQFGEYRSNERSYPQRYRSLLEPHLRRFYLDELEDVPDDSLEIGIIRLVVESEDKAGEFAKTLINKAKEKLTDTIIQRKVLEFIETIVVYKFPNLSREEIEAMLNLNLLKETRVYQEAKEEGELETKLKILPKLVQRGLSIQEIAELLELDAEIIRKALRD